MKNILIMGVAGAGLFVGTVVGLLGATGRLNYEGTQGLPLLSGLFEPPPAEADEAGAEGAGGKAGADGDAAHAVPAAPGPERNLDQAHSSNEELGDIFAEEAADPHGGGAAPDPAADADAHDNGHRVLDDIFAEAETGGHGAAPAADAGAHGESIGRDLSALEQNNQRPGAGESSLEKEHRYVMDALQSASEYEYETGRFFDFKGQTASISPDEINRFVALLQDRSSRLEGEIKAMAVRERELQDRERDVADQQQALAAARQAFQERQQRFDEQVNEFNRKVRLIQSQETPMLKNNAKALESFEIDVAREWVINLWATPEGQTEVLKTVFFMSKDGANVLLNEIGKKDGRMLEDILAKRKELAVEQQAAGN